MKYIPLKDYIKYYNDRYTSDDVIDAAYRTLADGELWDDWYARIASELALGQIEKLAEIARYDLSTLPKDYEDYALRHTSPAAPVSLEGGLRIPREFQEFLIRKVECAKPNYESES